jgi:hypothetical protein
MTWQPMSADDAQAVIAGGPPSGPPDAQRFAQWVEAWMVQAGTPPDRIQQAVESILGHPLD